MKYGNASLFKRFAASFILALFVSQVSVPALPQVGVKPAEAASVLGLRERALRKADVGLDDADSVSTLRKSNVLFLVEATATMSFSPKGVMPTVVLNRQGTADHGVIDWTQREGESGNWGATYGYYGLKQQDIIDMMRHATYGMGALPVAFYKKNIDRTERNLYGRDMALVDASDNENNWEGDKGSLEANMEFYKNRYYFPFAKTGSSPLDAAYSGQYTPLQYYFANAKPWRADHTDGGVVENQVRAMDGDPVPFDYSYKDDVSGTTHPYALVFKDPQYWVNPPSGALTATDLVPNDSRMYQAKLVLWNLLSDPALFQNLRIGLATTYLNPVNIDYEYNQNNHDGTSGAYDIHGIFRVWPYGNNLYARTSYNGVAGDQAQMKAGMTYYTTAGPYMQYKYGIMTQAITGQIRVTTRLHGQYVPVWANQTNEPLYGMAANLGRTDYQKSLAVYRVLNRGSLHVPIRDYDAVWERGTGADKISISQADKIRMWINGFADIANWHADSDRTGTQFHFYKDPEIGISGVFSLPSAIYPEKAEGRNRDYLMAPTAPDPILSAHDTKKKGFEMVNPKKYIVHSNKSYYTGYAWNIYAGSTQYEDPEFLANSQFIAGSGEATGSVIDFFSPYGVSDNTGLADVSYPMRSTCEDNWLIVIASGIELLTSEGVPSYHAWEAIQNLYDHTDKNNPNSLPVNMLVRNAAGDTVNTSGVKVGPDSDSRYFRREKLENPIRTLVIGMAPTMESVAGESAEIRSYVRMTRDNLNKMARAGQGKALTDTSVNAYFADDVETLKNAIEDALRFIADNQVQPSKGAILESPSLGDLTDDESFNYYSSMFRVRGDDQWEGYLTRFAVSENEDGSLTVAPDWELSRKIKGAAGRNLRYWSGPDGSTLAPLTADDYFKDSTGMATYTLMRASANSNIATFENYDPHRAVFRWLQGYDYSYEKSDEDFKRSSMMSDIGQGALAFVDDPGMADTLPGYGPWANGIATLRATDPKQPNIYVQTNDGILHVVDPVSGTEELAIVPPPVLVPSRIASFKSRFLSDNKFEWLDVLGEETEANSRDVVRTRSIPAYTLDGALQKRALSNSTGSVWNMRLLAGLGRGGSGLYMMDVDDRDDPKLMWYKERIGGSLLEMTPDASGHLPARPEIAGSPDPAFMKLGFNSPKAVMGVTGAPGNMMNFIALAGGMQNSIDLNNNGGEGAVLLMLDPEDGHLLTSFGAADVENKESIGTLPLPGPHPAMGMMVSEPALLRTSNGIKEGPYLTGSVYTADNRGTIFRVDMEETDSDGHYIRDLDPANWTINAVATLHPTALIAKGSADSYAIPFGVQAARDGGGNTWVAGGTSNLRTRNDGANPSGLLRNKSQMIFSFGTKSGHTIYGTDDLKTLAASVDVLTNADNKHGWKIDLPGADTGRSEEYVSAKPLLVNGVLYVGTFREDTVNWTSESMCSLGVRASGTSRLFALDVTNGRGLWGDGGKYATLEGAKITGISVSEYGKKKRIVVTYDNLSGGEVSLAGSERSGAQHVQAMSSFIFEAFGGGGTNLDKGRNVVQYWLNN